VDEIVAWPRLSAPEQWQVIERSALRRASLVSTQQVTAMNAPSNVVDRIKQQLSSSNVLLYMKGTPDFPQCGFSAAAVQALNAAGAQFDAVNIFEDPELREALKQYSNWPTYPQLYVKGELIGGADIIREMYQSGELQKVLSEAK
jgi:monothiol glutaredoxin